MDVISGLKETQHSASFMEVVGVVICYIAQKGRQDRHHSVYPMEEVVVAPIASPGLIREAAARNTTATVPHVSNMYSQRILGPPISVFGLTRQPSETS
jgi:hypothetical protein